MGIDNSQSRAAGKQAIRIYLVGGAVRDKLLDLPVVDRDWVVVGATREDMLDMGYQPVFGEFPVFIHPQTGEEYALARRETKTGPGYHGFSVEAGPDVTLEEDLARRDLTINAMAEDEQGSLIDPFHGQDDLENGLLRHVTPAFVEDPVRLLRIARFSARFSRWGFRIAHGTHALMKKMVAMGELAHLPGSRIWQEMRKALMEDRPWRFFEVLQSCGALAQLFPALAAAMAESSGHGGDIPDEPVEGLKRTVAANAGLAIRFTCIMQYAVDETHSSQQLISQLGIERKISALFEAWLQSRSFLVDLSRAEAGDILRYLRTSRDHLPALEQLTRCSVPGVAGTALSLLQEAAAAMSEVNARELQAQGWQGKALGEELARQQTQAIAQVLEKGHESG